MKEEDKAVLVVTINQVQKFNNNNSNLQKDKIPMNKLNYLYHLILKIK